MIINSPLHKAKKLKRRICNFINGQFAPIFFITITPSSQFTPLQMNKIGPEGAAKIGHEKSEAIVQVKMFCRAKQKQKKLFQHKKKGK